MPTDSPVNRRTEYRPWEEYVMTNLSCKNECTCGAYKAKGTCDCYSKMNISLMALLLVSFVVPIVTGYIEAGMLLTGLFIVALTIFSGGWIHRGGNPKIIQKRSWYLLGELVLISLIGTVLINISVRCFQNPLIDLNRTVSFLLMSVYPVLLVILMGLSGLARWRPNNPKPWMDWGVPVGLIVLMFGVAWYFFNLLAPSMKASYLWVITSLIGVGVYKVFMDLLPENVRSLIYKEWLEQRGILLLCVVLEFIFLIQYQTVYDIETIGFAFPVLILLYNGAKMMAGEDDHKTMDYLISKPLSLNQIFWSKFMVGVLPALYLLFCYAFLAARFLSVDINMRSCEEISIVAFVMVVGPTLVYCFASFWSVLFRDTIRSVLGIIIGGVLLGASYGYIVFNRPFSLLDMFFSLNVGSVLEMVIQFLGITFLAIGMVGFLFLWKLRKRCVWKSSFVVLIGTGFCLLLFTPLVVIGPRPAVTRYTKDMINYTLSAVEIRGDKLFHQIDTQTLWVTKLEADKTEAGFEVSLKSKPDRYNEVNMNSSFIYGDDSFITLETASSGVYVYQLSLDTYDWTTIRVVANPNLYWSAPTSAQYRSKVTLTPKVLKEVKLPPVKDLSYAWLMADGDNCYIRYVCKSYRKNPNYKKDTTHKPMPGFGMAYGFSDEDPSISIVTSHFAKDVYVLGKDDLSIKEHYIFDTTKRFNTARLIQNRYLFQTSDYSGNNAVIIDTFAWESSKEWVVNTIPYKVGSYYLDSSDRMYIATPGNLLAVMDVKDVRNIKVLGTIPLSFRDKLSLGKFYGFNYLQKGNRLIFWNTTNYYVADISHPDKPVLLFRRIIPRKMNLREQKLCWDPKMNSFRLIARGINGYLYVGDYPSVMK